jgi:hypothetical protein
MACPKANTGDKVILTHCPKYLDRGARQRARTVIRIGHDAGRDGRLYILGDNRRDNDNKAPSNCILHSKNIRLATGKRGRPSNVELGHKRKWHHHRPYRRVQLCTEAM